MGCSLCSQDGKGIEIEVILDLFLCPSLICFPFQKCMIKSVSSELLIFQVVLYKKVLKLHRCFMEKKKSIYFMVPLAGRIQTAYCSHFSCMTSITQVSGPICITFIVFSHRSFYLPLIILA